MIFRWSWELPGGSQSASSEFLEADADGEWQCMDATIVKAHQHASGARGKGDEAIGHSRGGATTKLHALCDASGNPTKLVLTKGEASDVKTAPELLAAVLDGAEVIIADKAYDAAHVREDARSRGMTPVIPFRTCTQEGCRVRPLARVKRLLSV